MIIHYLWQASGTVCYQSAIQNVSVSNIKSTSCKSSSESSFLFECIRIYLVRYFFQDSSFSLFSLTAGDDFGINPWTPGLAPTPGPPGIRVSPCAGAKDLTSVILGFMSLSSLELPMEGMGRFREPLRLLLELSLEASLARVEGWAWLQLLLLLDKSKPIEADGSTLGAITRGSCLMLAKLPEDDVLLKDRSVGVNEESVGPPLDWLYRFRSSRSIYSSCFTACSNIKCAGFWVGFGALAGMRMGFGVVSAGFNIGFGLFWWGALVGKWCPRDILGWAGPLLEWAGLIDDEAWLRGGWLRLVGRLGLLGPGPSVFFFCSSLKRRYACSKSLLSWRLLWE